MKKKEEVEPAYRLTKKQKAFLSVYENSACNVSVAAKKCGITRKTFYDWQLSNPKFKQLTEELKESMIDYAESKLHLNIKEGKEASIFFFLKTQGKSRGYIETVENHVTVNPFEELLKAATSEDGD